MVYERLAGKTNAVLLANQQNQKSKKEVIAFTFCVSEEWDKPSRKMGVI